MKIKGSYVLDTIGKETMAVPLDTRDDSQVGIVKLNDVGAFLWERLQEDTTEEKLLGELTEKYDVDQETAKQDVRNFLEKLEDKGILER